MSLKQGVLLPLLCAVIQFSFISANLTFYGNEVKERSTSGLDSSIHPPGPRIWIDDPLNCNSCPRWGYLQYYRVYIHALPSSVPLPRLFLQIWSNMTTISNYTLKWQKSLDNYQPGKLYEVAPDAGHVVEVNEFDRLGFTSEGNGNAVALDLETDDAETFSTAHRTYFRLLYRDNNVLPAIGDSRYVDNYALRGRFSIGVLLDNAPPRKSSEVYLGHELIRRKYSGRLFQQVVVDDSVELVSGRVTAFYFRLAQLTKVTSVQFYIWQKISNSNNYILTYSRSSTIDPSPEKTYNLSIIDGPMVNRSHRFGWNISEGLFYSSAPSGACHTLDAGQGSSNSVGQTYAFDGLAWPYNMSIGVIVDQPLTNNGFWTPSSSNSAAAGPVATRLVDIQAQHNSCSVHRSRLTVTFLCLVVMLRLWMTSISS